MRRRIPLLLASPGVLALLVEPLAWLFTTWTDPAYDSPGGFVALACAVVVVRAVRSGPAVPDPTAARRAVALLLTTAAVRLAGRLLAIRIVGALALVFDVAALGIALGVARRPRPIHPGALALLFAFALPLEQLLQRLVGFPLRWLSAAVAEGALAPFYPALTRHGTLLSHPGVDLSVDLPCSGAQGLVLLGALAAAIACGTRARLPSATLAVLTGALVANTLRIATLFVGTLEGLPVLAEPWHSLVGLVGLGVGALPLLALAARWPRRSPAPTAAAPRPATRPRAVHAVAFSAAGLVIAAAPASPLDVSRPTAAAPSLPGRLGDFAGEALPLSDVERAYFERFGGRAEKRAYTDGLGAPFSVLRVRTTAPLRHLHGPDQCLLGAGHRVERLGVRAGAPVVVWRSTGPDGRAWRIESLFVSDAGETAATVSEVAWRWLGAPGTAWQLVERVSPWSACAGGPARCRDFGAAMDAALDLPRAFQE